MDISKCSICIDDGLLENLVKGNKIKYQRPGCPSYFKFSDKDIKLVLSLTNNHACNSSLHISCSPISNNENKRNINGTKNVYFFFIYFEI